LPPIKVDAGGSEVLIRGKIDRLDVMHEDAVRVVDYKTGSDTVDVDHIRGGYKLQLMIYLKAAVEGLKSEPAGVFYFKIDDLETDADKVSVSAGDGQGGVAGNPSERLDDSYRLVGIVLNDEKLINAMDSELIEEGSGSSKVVPVKITGKNRELKAAAGGHLMEHEEFGELMQQVDMQVKRICSEICSGTIDIKPKKERKQSFGGHKTACRYCEYKSICMFDTAFDGCHYELI
ncbi:MAG: PD-(D/E)XK nuclease family protein, partial [Firmicutes bacterium]|nr:PD-(D/E)XK nuclease family protein [Bacillota bacterium]